jgi:hypothetical protein
MIRDGGYLSGAYIQADCAAAMKAGRNLSVSCDFIRSSGSTRRSHLLSTVIVMMKVEVMVKFVGRIKCYP